MTIDRRVRWSVEAVLAMWALINVIGGEHSKTIIKNSSLTPANYRQSSGHPSEPGHRPQ